MVQPKGARHYNGSLFPELQGKLIVTFHGKGSNGQRIVAYDVDGRGVPNRPPDRPGGLPGFPQLVLDKWYKIPNERPKGRPGGLLVANDGRIWFVDYANKTVMVLMRDQVH